MHFQLHHSLKTYFLYHILILDIHIEKLLLELLSVIRVKGSGGNDSNNHIKEWNE